MGSEVFDGVRYHIIENNVKSPVDVKQIFKEGGASREFYISELVTHIISDVPVDSEALSLDNYDCVIVHSDWAVMSLKCGVQLPTVPFESSSGKKLLSDLVFCPSKLCSSDVEKLCVVVLFHGGKMQRRLDSKVTHLVTMETSGAKYDYALKHSELKVVTPDWILDSIDSEIRMEEEEYHPSFFKRESENQKSDSFNGCVPLEPGHETPLDGSSSRDSTTVPMEESAEGQSGSPGNKDLAVGSTREDEPTSIMEELVPCERKLPPEEKAQQGEEKLSLPPATGPELLLDGVVICFTDYQDCVEDDTLEKWKLVVRQHGGKVLDEYDSNHCTHLLALHKKSNIFAQALGEGKCISSAHWLNDVLTKQKMFPPRNAIHFPTAFKWQLPNAEHYSMTLTNYTDMERELVKDMLRICGITYTGHLSRESTHLICKRPEGKKYEKALEWGVQVVNSTFLADTIHNGQVPSVIFPRYTSLNQLEEFNPGSCPEARRLLDLWKPFLRDYAGLHPGLLEDSGWISLISGCEEESRNCEFPGVRMKRHIPEEVQDIGGGVKKRKVCGNPSSLRVLFTGISLSVVKKLKQIVLKLGATVTDNGRECSHIVTPRIARTVKFMCGISVCDHVVTPKWVEESGRHGAFLEESDFLLVDSEAEKLFGMDIATSIFRAKTKKLLEGMCVHATPTVQPPFDSLKEIVGSAGGELLNFPEFKSRCLEKLMEDVLETLIVLSTPSDIESGCCKEFMEMGVNVYNAELILTGVLKQELDCSLHIFSMDT